MTDYKRLTKAELDRELEGLEGLTATVANDDESARLLHELQVRQVQLEMQNRALREAQHELEASHDCYADLYDFAPVGYLTFDGKGKVVEANLTAAAILGRAREQILNSPFTAYLAPECAKKFLDHLREVFRAGGNVTTELRLSDVKGACRDVRLESSAHGNGEDSVRRCRSVLFDIGEQKAVEAELRANRRYFREIAEHVPGLLFRVDKHGRYTFVNHRCEEWFGLSTESILGKHIRDVLGEDSYELIKEYVDGALSGQALSFETEVPFVRGGRRWVSAEYIPDVEKTGDVVGFFAFVADITARKRAEGALRESEERFRTMFEQHPDACFIYGLDGRVLDCNDMAEQLGGLRRTELIGRNYRELGLLGSAEVAKVARNLRQLASGIPLDPAELEVVRPDGARLRVEVRSYRTELNGRPVVLGSARDITERTRFEEQLIRYRERLRDLASKTSLAEERERRRIAAGLHDTTVQTLGLSKIKLDMLRGRLAPGTEHDRFDELSGLLDQAIADTRSLLFELSPPVLYDLGFEAAVEWLCDQCTGQHGYRCAMESDARLCTLSEEISVVLFQATRELLSNVKAHARAKQVTVALRRIAEQLEVAVIDDGIGFDTMALTRERGELRRFQRGRGFGLFSIRERLTLLGGNVEVRSNVGEGTTVVLTVPLDREARA